MSMPGLIFAVGAAVTWGAVYTIDQRILGGTAPLQLLVLDSIITAAILAPLLFFRRFTPTMASIPSVTWVLIVASVALACLANLLIYSGIKLLGASKASIFEIAYPLFVVLFNYSFLKVKPTILFLVGASLILVGAAVIIAAGS